LGNGDRLAAQAAFSARIRGNVMSMKQSNTVVLGVAALGLASVLSAIPSTARAADPGYCAQYARLAVHEAQVLSTLPCFKGFDNTWHLDYQRHYGWCLTADVHSVDAQRDYRRMRIYQCGGH
jgi:hypothetical protein